MALAALNVYYRDIQYIWAVVLQIGFFATPVIYPLSVFPLYLQKILSYNPIAQVIFLARDITLYSKEPNPASFVFVIFIAMIILGIGYVIFMRLEKRFAEEL
jgi:lipopolysaccharide transport system permease protein